MSNKERLGNHECLELNEKDSLEYYEKKEYRLKINCSCKKLSLKLNNSEISNLNAIVKMHFPIHLETEKEAKKRYNNFGILHVLKLHDCDKINDVSMVGFVDKLIFVNCKKIKDISTLASIKKHNSTSLSDLSVHNCKKIKDVGNLRKLKKLTINEYVEGIHLLKELEKLIINGKCDRKMKNRIKKLKEINPKVWITNPIWSRKCGH